MSRPLTCACLIASLTACVAGGARLPGDASSPTGGKLDLPNDSFWEREHDAYSYREIAKYYRAEGYDLRTRLDLLEASWPMRESGTALLGRFGTPQRLDSYGYFHTALDIIRRDVSESAEVLAPFSGAARVFHWWGEPGYTGKDYETVVAIWDPRSHVIAQLMHVRPTRDLTSATGFIEVREGQVIGTLANDLTWLSGQHRETYRHTHTNLIDGGRMLALNPAYYLPYRDSIAPEAVDLYLLDEEARKHSTLRSGQLDVVLEVRDRDDDSGRTFEVGSIEYEITDQTGRILLDSPRCRFEDLFTPIEEAYTDRTLRLVDFGNAVSQIAGSDWPSSDLANPERTFRYALTQFYVDRQGRCEVRRDYEGYLDVLDAHTEITVRARIWDHSGNVRDYARTLRRRTHVPSAPPPTITVPSAPRPRTTTVFVDAVVESTSGSLTVRRGDSCQLSVDVRDKDDGTGYWCQATLTCGGVRLYGGTDIGFFDCAVYDQPVAVTGVDSFTTSEDTDPALAIDTRTGTLIVHDDGSNPAGAFRIDARTTRTR